MIRPYTVMSVLGMMQNPYRNSTMHLDRKYNSDEALVIMNAVRQLMTTIAARMDENGEPKGLAPTRSGEGFI